MSRSRSPGAGSGPHSAAPHQTWPELFVTGTGRGRSRRAARGTLRAAPPCLWRCPRLGVPRSVPREAGADSGPVWLCPGAVRARSRWYRGAAAAPAVNLLREGPAGTEPLIQFGFFSYFPRLSPALSLLCQLSEMLRLTGRLSQISYHLKPLGRER